MENKTKIIKVVSIIAGAAFVAYLAYRIYKYQNLKSGNRIKDERKIKIVKQ